MMPSNHQMEEVYQKLGILHDSLIKIVQIVAVLQVRILFGLQKVYPTVVWQLKHEISTLMNNSDS